MKKTLSLALVLMMALALLTGCSGGKAGGWAKNVEVQVPAKAGGGTDVMARTLAEYVSKESGSNLTIVNNTDGAGIVACEKVRTADTDGSVIMQFHTSLLIKIATGVYDKSVTDDFTVLAVSKTTDTAGYVLVVAGDYDCKTLDELIAKAKAKPGELLIGIETGGSSHVMAGLFSRAAGIDLKFVEAGADTEKLTALVGKSIDMCLVNPNQAKQYIESGKTIGLAVVSTDDSGQRGTTMPDIPSFIEQGVNFSYTNYNIILGPKGMDEALADKICEYYTAAAEDADVQALLVPAGFGMKFMSRADGVAALKAQQEALNAVVADLGLHK